MPFLDTPETNALKSKVEKLLLEIPYFTDENKNLKINVIKDYADNGNVKLLEPLLKNAQTKKAFSMYFAPVKASFGSVVAMKRMRGKALCCISRRTPLLPGS